jgi:hypothetical protein
MLGLAAWFTAIALPLCVAGNKQSHYLIPLMPVLMIMAGRMIDMQDYFERTTMVALCISALLLPPIVTCVIPRLVPGHTRETAQLVRDQVGDHALIVYGANQSIPLCFNLRREIPFAKDDAELDQLIARQPESVIITIGKDKRPASAPATQRFEKVNELKRDDQIWAFYRHIAD